MYDDYRNLINRNKEYDFSKLQIYDVTLRDGEQTPRVAFSVLEKIEIAKQLNKLGIKYIEAGFPASSDDDKEAVKKIIDLNLDFDVYALARLDERDVDIAYECGVKHLVLFSPTSEYLLKYNLKTDINSRIEKLKRIVDYAKRKDMYVRFGCEDASRTEYERLVKVYTACYECGADMVAFADTLGMMTPSSMKDVVGSLKRDIKIPLAVHCHNDFGLGLGNVLAAIEAGVEQVHVSINGLGERTGNVSLEELIMCLLIQYNCDMGIDISKIYEVSQRLYELSGCEVPFNKPIVGKNTFTHESGLHVSGILANPMTYQPFPAELIGRENTIVLGKHSGKSSIKYFARKNGLSDVSEEKISEALSSIKSLASKKKNITEEMLLNILNK